MCSGGSKRRHSSTVAAVASGVKKKRRGSPPCARMARDRIAGLMHGGLVAGIEQQDGRRDQLVFGELLAVLLGGDQQRQQIVARPLAPLGDVAAQEIGKFARRAIGRSLRSPGCGRACTWPPCLWDQSSSCGPISTGTPSISAMIVIGSGEAKAGSRSTARPASNRSMSSFGQCLEARPEPFDLTRYEGPVDQCAQLRVDAAAPAPACELASTASKPSDGPVPSHAALSGTPAGLWRPKRRSLKSRPTSSKPPKHQKPIILPEEGAALAVKPRIGFIGVLEESAARADRAAARRVAGS